MAKKKTVKKGHGKGHPGDSPYGKVDKRKCAKKKKASWGKGGSSYTW